MNPRWQVIHGDCREVLPTLGQVDALITDPPYGIDAARDRNSQDAGWKDYPSSGWDKERADPEVIRQCVRAAKVACVWGGNYFTDALAPSMGWLVWDKGQRDFSLADCELAWTNRDKAVRCLTFPRAKALADGKVHPTQKPIALMVWTIEQLTDPDDLVLDPFCGSGTTGVACLRLGRRFIGIEKEATYAAVARERLEAESQGLSLRDARAGQLPMFGGES